MQFTQIILIWLSLLPNIDIMGHSTNILRAALAAILLALPAGLQAQRWDGCDTTLVSGGYKVTFAAVENDSPLAERLIATYEAAGEWGYPPRRVVEGHDAVTGLLREDIGFREFTFRWDASITDYIGEITCRNGMRLIFRDPVTIRRYYPDCDVIVLGNGPTRTINLTTGEDDRVIEYIDEIEGGLRIIGVRTESEDGADGDLGLFVQQPEPGGRWATILDLTGIMNDRSRCDLYDVVGGKLYILSYDQWWNVGFEKTNAR